MQNNNHIAVGFYLNETFKVNVVADGDLQNNIEYNKKWRPGRFYFVDGEYVCGGVLAEPHKSEFIQKCKNRLQNIHVDKSKITKPYV